uniref:CCT domain-containing protein n=1 Tax=Peronospora matthiolae TaxID=2874970 RepID=A0AAV1T2V9_9STRA
MSTTTYSVAKAAASNVDSRVFVPAFTVRIEGGHHSRPLRPAVGLYSTDLLVGPPGVLSATSIRNERVDRLKSKRSCGATQPDPSISHKRRASAAKRQRVKGRFVRDTHTFVSITALQK